MQINTRITSNHSILELNGRLVLGKDLLELRSAVRDAAGKNPIKMTLDLENVTYIDSCGIGELVSVFKYVKSQGGCLVLTNLPKRIKILLDTAQLTKVLGVSDSKQTTFMNPSQQIPLRQIYS